MRRPLCDTCMAKFSLPPPPVHPNPFLWLRPGHPGHIRAGFSPRAGGLNHQAAWTQSRLGVLAELVQMIAARATLLLITCVNISMKHPLWCCVLCDLRGRGRKWGTPFFVTSHTLCSFYFFFHTRFSSDPCSTKWTEHSPYIPVWWITFWPSKSTLFYWISPWLKKTESV